MTTQGIKVAGWPRKLTWNDFKILDKPLVPNRVAWTAVEIVPTDGGVGPSTGVLRLNCLLNVNVQLRLIPERTWVLKGRNTPQYLLHEQGHFDIAGLIARELHFRLSLVSSPSSPAAVIAEKQKVKDAMAKKLKAIETRYDSETKSGDDPGMQSRWNGLIQVCITGNQPLPDA